MKVKRISLELEAIDAPGVSLWAICEHRQLKLSGPALIYGEGQAARAQFEIRLETETLDFLARCVDSTEI